VLDKQTLRLVPLRFKPAQIRLIEWMLERYLAGQPVRVVILKARREGVSTAIQAFFFWLTSASSPPDRGDVEPPRRYDPGAPCDLGAVLPAFAVGQG
jgi:hypothetical protein